MRSRKNKRIAHHRTKSSGRPPGTIIYTGLHTSSASIIHHVSYDATNIRHTIHHNEIPTITSGRSDEVDWFDVRGIHDIALITAFQEAFKLHPLIVEDAVDVHQRPKFESYPEGVFFCLKAMRYNVEDKKVETEQISIYFRHGIVLTFQEHESDLLENIRDRLTQSLGRIRNRGADYLSYAIIDYIVDNYYGVLFEIEQDIMDLEEQITLSTEEGIKHQLHHLKRESLLIRKNISPLREAVSQMMRSENKAIERATFVFMKDLYDHTVQIMDTNESHRDMLNSLQDLYLSEISYKMNEVMKILTVITTIFVPLTFIVGIYGMNFRNMPELETEYGYYVVLGVMFLIFVGSLWYFKKKRWF